MGISDLVIRVTANRYSKMPRHEHKRPTVNIEAVSSANVTCYVCKLAYSRQICMIIIITTVYQ